MANLPGGVRRTVNDFPIHNESRAQSGAERQKNEMPQISPTQPHAKMKLRQRPGVTVVLNKDR